MKLRQEIFGKSGARRIVPGQYLANRSEGTQLHDFSHGESGAANLTISSPLEAHKNNAIIHHIVGVDVGFGLPMYAALEVEYTEADQDLTGELITMRRRCVVCISWFLGHLIGMLCRCSHFMS